jgi:AcrR family transcriptional regulator
MTPTATRRILLDAAAEEFARHGLRGTRVHAIVRRAGVNERMIYHYFGSKDGLYRAVLADQWSGLATAWQHALQRASRLEPREGLKLAFSALFTHFAERHLVIPLAMHESMGGWKNLPHASLTDVPGEVRALYARGQREGVFRRDCSFDALYLTLMGALTSLWTVALRFSDMRTTRRRGPASRTRLAEHMIELVIDGARLVDTPHHKRTRRRT